MKPLSEWMGRVAVPLVTPFHDDEELNLDATALLADYVVAKNYCDSLILTGTTGEFYALEDQERIAVWNAVSSAVGTRVPLVAGVGAPDTQRAVRLAATAERLGFKAIMVVLPYYSKPTQEGLARHFAGVAAAVSVPILLYNIPLFTGVNLEPDTLECLAQIPNIRGIKEEAGIQPTQATAYAARTSPEFSIYCGDDTMVLQVLPQRGVGVVSGGSQVIGNLMKEMIAGWFAGDNQRASRIYFSLAPFFAALNQNGRINPIPILRAAIEMTSGIPIGPPRGPQLQATAGERAVIGAVLEKLQAGAEIYRSASQ
jgi:4-hydroxy-tetrahydrodipicolinate synthase